MSRQTIPCVIFAGGKSSRMGKDKAFLPFAKSPTLIGHQVNRLKKLFTLVYISAKEEGKFKDIDAPVLTDLSKNDIHAPTLGLISTFHQLKSEDAFFVLSVDTPFVNEELIQKLSDVPRETYDAVIARSSTGIHPLCGIYTRTLEAALNEMVEKGEHKLTKLLDSVNVCYVDVEDEELLLNMNTPDDYQHGLEQLKA